MRSLQEIIARSERRRLVLPRRAAAVPRGGRIFFLTPDFDRPAGGIRVIYRHVDILNAAGLPATVVHQRPGFRCSWFENSTRVRDVASVCLGPRDLLVLAEVDGDLMLRLPPGMPHVVFNQNSHLTWAHGGQAVSRHYADRPDLLAVLVVSEHCAAMLRYAFPGTRVGRVHLGLDRSLFYSDPAQRRRRITYMPRRGSGDAGLVLHLLRERGVLEGWEVAALDGLPHEGVAAMLRTSQIFLAFTYQEGFGLPAAEAAACGNRVVGYHGFGGREFFDAFGCTPIGLGDVLGFADGVEAIIRALRDDDPDQRLRTEASARAIAEAYSLDRERNDVVAFYEPLLAGIGRPSCFPPPARDERGSPPADLA